LYVCADGVAYQFPLPLLFCYTQPCNRHNRAMLVCTSFQCLNASMFLIQLCDTLHIVFLFVLFLFVTQCQIPSVIDFDLKPVLIAYLVGFCLAFVCLRGCRCGWFDQAVRNAVFQCVLEKRRKMF